MKTFSIVNTKGGVGKTVTAVHLGHALAQAGRDVLLIDTDLQAGLTGYFQVDIAGRPTMADVLSGAVGLEEAMILVRPRLWIVPATSSLERSEVELASASGGEVRLTRAMKRARQAWADAEAAGPDVALIDCPSGWGAVTRNALIASSAMIVPVNSEPAAVSNANATISATWELCEYHDRRTELLGVVLTRFRGTNAARAIETQACRLWPDKLFTTRIRQAERVNELAISRETTSDVPERDAGAVGADYRALALEVIERGAL